MMTKTSPGAPRRPKSKRPRRQFTRKSVLKMLAVMSEDTTDASKDFLTTGRVGRRNAMADILSDHALTTTSDLPEKLNMCSISDVNPEKPTDGEEKGEQDPAHGANESAPNPES